METKFNVTVTIAVIGIIAGLALGMISAFLFADTDVPTEEEITEEAFGIAREELDAGKIKAFEGVFGKVTSIVPGTIVIENSVVGVVNVTLTDKTTFDTLSKTLVPEKITISKEDIHVGDSIAVFIEGAIGERKDVEAMSITKF